MDQTAKAERYENRNSSMQDFADSVIQGGAQYSATLNSVAEELEAVALLDPFAWAKPSVEESSNKLQHGKF